MADHEFEAQEICNNCGEDVDNCDCEDDDQDIMETTECKICGDEEEDHADDDDE